MPPAEGDSQCRDPGSNPGGKGAFCPQSKGNNNSACRKALGGAMTGEPSTKGASRGPSSFCIPRSALDALLDAKATAYEICAYLVLAKFTDESGRYSTASITAVNTYTGANKTKGGPVDRAIERLKTINAKSKQLVPNGRSGKHHAMIEQVNDLGPILFDRGTWHTNTGAVLPDGPHERAVVLHVLPDFGEPMADRIWFGNNLVNGVGGFNQPLKALKNAGDVAARLLLTMYAANDMETWGGVRPVGPGSGPWKRYEPVGDALQLRGGVRLIRAKDQGTVSGTKFSHAWPAPGAGSWWTLHDEAGGPVWRALEALESVGLAYEMVLVLNRNAFKSKFSSGAEYGAIPDDAEPFYELDCRSQHGYKPEGEEGLGGATASTAGDFGHSVAIEGGQFDGTYAAIVPNGYGAMIAGIYRLRFRVANAKNAGVKSAWARIHQNNRDAFDLVQRVRAASKLAPLTPPWEISKIARSGQNVVKPVAVDTMPF